MKGLGLSMIKKSSMMAVSVTGGMLLLEIVMGNSSRWHDESGQLMSLQYFLYYALIFFTAFFVNLFWEWVKERPHKK